MSIDQLFESFNHLKVLVIGDIMLDSYIWGSVDRMSPEAPVPVVSVKEKGYRLGGAGNVVVNLRALGAQPIICSLIGQDDAGKKVRGCLVDSGISDAGLVTSPSRPTPEKTRIIAHGQHVVRVDEEVDAPPSPEEEEQIIKKIGEILPQANVIIFEDYDKGTLSTRIIEATVQLALQHGIPTVVDPKKRNFLSYRQVTLFKPNVKELREGLKIEIDGGRQETIEKAVNMVKERLQVKGVMATLSEHGIYIDYQQVKAKIPAHSRKIADVSGAGDTVVAVAGLCVALEVEPEKIAILSNLGGGLVCQHVGVVALNKEEFRKEAIRLFP